jgi:uncharacterized protein YciI
MSQMQVVTHAPGPAWVQGTSFQDQPGIGDHLTTLQGWVAQGRLVLAGPFLDQGAGGMAVVRFDDVEDARAAAKADPAVGAGLLTAHVRPWHLGLAGVDLGGG